LTNPREVNRLAHMSRFTGGQFPLVLNRGYRCKTYGANRIVAPVGIVPMWEALFQQCEHLSPLN
jgi:hypothetical protein